MSNKLYAYYIGENLAYVSPDKELLQEILVDDYFDLAYYTYNHNINTPHKFYPTDAIDFWKVEKEHPFLYEQYIIDLEDYYIE